LALGVVATHVYERIGGVMSRSRLVAMIAGLSCGLILAITTGGVAGRLSVSSGTFRQVYNPLTFEAESTIIRCPVTLEGSYNSRTIQKVTETSIGYITRAGAAESACTGGRATFKSESLPWSMSYDRFTGTLPNISTASRFAIGAVIDLEILPGLVCRYEAVGMNNRFSITLRKSGDRIIQVDFNAPVLPNPFNRAGCPTLLIIFRGSGTLTVLGGTTAVSLTLI
jgi:hypothetical protein